MSLYVAAYWLAFLPLTWGALRWGGKPERSILVIFVAATIATLLVRPAWPARFRSVEYGVLLVDAAALVAAGYVALRADRIWPIFTTALQLLSTTAHFAKVINPNLLRSGYAIMRSADSIPLEIVLAIGIYNQWRRKRAASISPGSSTPP